MKLRQMIKELVYRLRGEYTTERLINMGMVVGTNFKRLNSVILDPSHCWLIEIGNNVTLAPRVHILCHDASTKTWLNYTRIGRVEIGDNVFVGAESVILPGVKIGSNVVIGANSTVTHDIPSDSIAVGSPARVIGGIDDFIAKNKSQMEKSVCYGEEFTLRRKVSMEMRKRQKDELKNRIGYID